MTPDQMLSFVRKHANATGEQIESVEFDDFGDIKVVLKARGDEKYKGSTDMLISTAEHCWPPVNVASATESFRSHFAEMREYAALENPENIDMSKLIGIPLIRK